MRVGYICSRRLVTVDRDGTLAAAAALMREHHVGALVVTAETSDGPVVQGIVTDRDLVIDVLADGLAPGEFRIGEIAHPLVAAIGEDEDASRAIETMQAAGVRRLVVADAEQNLTGIVSLDDLLLACGNDMAGLAAVIRTGMEREAAEVAEAALRPPAPVRVPSTGTSGWGAART